MVSNKNMRISFTSERRNTLLRNQTFRHFVQGATFEKRYRQIGMQSEKGDGIKLKTEFSWERERQPET